MNTTMTEADIPSPLMAKIKEQFENDARIRDMRIKQSALQRAHDYVGALTMGKNISFLFSAVIKNYIDEMEKDVEHIDINTLKLSAQQQKKLMEITITMFMACDMIETAIIDFNDEIKKTDPALEFNMFDDIRELNSKVKVKLEYLRKNSSYMKDLTWADECDNMYSMLRNKARKIVKS